MKIKLILKPMAGVICAFFFHVPPAIALQVNIVLSQTGTNFIYTVFNNEASNSIYYVNSVHLVLSGPIAGVSSPAGWTYVTDDLSYIDWITINSNSPEQDAIAPGNSLTGFAIESQMPSSELQQYAISSWDINQNNTGASFIGSVTSPSLTTVAPTLTPRVYSISNGFQCSVVGVPGFLYSVQTSTNLMGWSSVYTNTSPFIFQDTNSLFSGHKFYMAGFVSGSLDLAPD